MKRRKSDFGVLLTKFTDGGQRPPLRRGRGEIGPRCRLSDPPALLKIDRASEVKAAPPAEPATVYRDSLLSRLLVVQHDARLWLCPPGKNGWAACMPLEMTVEARAERLRPARDVSAAWLCVTDAAAEAAIAQAERASSERTAADATGDTNGDGKAERGRYAAHSAARHRDGTEKAVVSGGGSGPLRTSRG